MSPDRGMLCAASLFVGWLSCDGSLLLAVLLSCGDESHVFSVQGTADVFVDASGPCGSSAGSRSSHLWRAWQSAASPNQCLPPHDWVPLALFQPHKQTRRTKHL